MGRQPSWPPRPHVHRPSGQERVRYKDKDYYLGPAGSQKARREYARLLAELAGQAQPPPAEPKSPTVAQVAALWQAHAMNRYGESNPEVASYDRALAPLLARFERLPAAQIDCDRLEEVREAMTARGWCRNYANASTTRIRTVWRWAERKKLVPPGSWAALRALPPLPALSPGVRETRPVRPADWPALARVCRRSSPKVRAMLLVQWFTGCRPSDLRRMRAGEVDRSGPVWLYRPPVHKTAWRGHERVVPIGPKAQRVLAPWLEGKGEEGLVFPARGGTMYTRHGFGCLVWRAAKAAGVRFHAYQSRHAFRRRVSREHGLEAARAAMGHASVHTTAGYARGTDEALASDVAKKVG